MQKIPRSDRARRKLLLELMQLVETHQADLKQISRVLSYPGICWDVSAICSDIQTLLIENALMKRLLAPVGRAQTQKNQCSW